MLFIELNDLSHSVEDIAIVKIAISRGFNVAIFEEFFKSLNKWSTFWTYYSDLGKQYKYKYAYNY